MPVNPDSHTEGLKMSPPIDEVKTKTQFREFHPTQKRKLEIAKTMDESQGNNMFGPLDNKYGPNAGTT
jgi:hypothetical protein